MANNFIVLVLMVSIAVVIDTAPSQSFYCDLKSCKGPTHTACIYDFLRTSDQCGKVTSSNLTATEIQEAVDAHNMYRAFVASGQEIRGNSGPQPAATNLGPLKWDEELAEIAQTWANQCEYAHDKCRNVERFRVGQNVAFSGTTGRFHATIFDLVSLWYEEVELFDKNQVVSVTDFDDVGHYTQMMWADTTLVGCGIVRYNNDGKWNNTHLVCNYGPTGNWVGGQMYKTG